MNETVLLEIRTIAGQARREIGALARDLVTFGTIDAEATVGIDTKDATAHLDVLEKRLKSFDKSKADAFTNIQIADTLAKIELLKSRLKDVDGKEIDIGVRKGLIGEISALEAKIEGTKGLIPSGGGVGPHIKKSSADTQNALGDLARQFENAVPDSIDGPKINFGPAMAQIAEFKTVLSSIDREKVSVKANVEIASALFEIEVLERKLKSVDGKNIDIHTRRGILSDISALERRVVGLASGLAQGEKAASRFGTEINRTSRFVAAISKNVTDVVRIIPILGTVVSEIGQTILTTGTSSGKAFLQIGASIIAAGVAAAGFVIILNYIATLISALIGLIAGLVASLAMAAAGVAALAVGFAAALGPAIGIAILLFERFQKILQARQARETALKQAVRDRNQAEIQSLQTQDRIKNAQESVDQALQGTKDAQDNLAEAFKAGMREMRDAAEEVKKSILGVEDAQLSLAESRLGVREAEKALKDFRNQAKLTGIDFNDLVNKAKDVDFDPRRLTGLLSGARGKSKSLNEDQRLELERLTLALRRAKLGEKQANQGLTDSENTLSDAREKNTEFINKGVKAYKPYVSALRQVKDANKALVKAQEAQVETLKEISLEAKTQTNAMAEYKAQRDKLSGAEQGFLDRLNKVLGGLSKLTRAFTDPIFTAINGVFDRISGSAGSFNDVLTDLGKAIGDIVTSLGDFFNEGATRSGFREMARGAASLARSLGARAFVDFLRIMRNIARAVLPDVIRKGESVANTFHRWAQQTSNVGRLRKHIQPLIDAFNTWWDIIKLLAEDFILFVRDASGPASHIAKSIKGWLTDLRKFLDSKHGRDEVKKWLQKSAETAKDFWEGIKKAAHYIKVLGEYAKDALGPVGKLLDILSKGKDIFDKLPGVLKIGPEYIAGKRSPLNELLKAGGLPHLQSGGPTGPGGVIDSHPGEYVVRSAVVSALGMPFFDALNAGRLNGTAPSTSTSSKSIHQQVDVNVAGGGSPNERILARLLYRELQAIGGA